jgi:hypothetical protein
VVDAIKDCSHRGDIVLDPFGGSGTALIAAHRAGRKARLMEFDPRYVDLIVRRFQAVMLDERTQSMIFRIAEGYDKIAASVEKRHAARDSTAGDVSVGHIPGFIGKVRDSLDELAAAGVERSALEQRLQKLESAAASEDKGLVHETLVELKGFVTNSATKLVSSGVVSLIDQILGFPSP